MIRTFRSRWVYAKPAPFAVSFTSAACSELVSWNSHMRLNMRQNGVCRLLWHSDNITSANATFPQHPHEGAVPPRNSWVTPHLSGKQPW